MDHEPKLSHFSIPQSLSLAIPKNGYFSHVAPTKFERRVEQLHSLPPHPTNAVCFAMKPKAQCQW